MPIPSTAKGVGDLRKLKFPLATALDVMQVGDEGYWVKRSSGANPIPNSILRGQQRNPGHIYVWDYEGEGFRVWRKA